MTASPVTIIYALIGGLLLTAIVAWIRKNRLAVLLPKLFTYSHLPQMGQLIEITIFNRGFKTEEVIEVFLNPRLSYQMIGATIQNVILDKDTLTISRVGGGDDATIILLVQNGDFTKTDILRCISKETTGKLYSSLELIPSTGNQRIALVVVFLLMPALMALAFFSYVKPRIDAKYAIPSPPAANTIAVTAPDWNVAEMYARAAGELYKDFLANKLTPEIGAASFKGDRVSIPVTFFNETDGPLDFSLHMNTTASIDVIPSHERGVGEVIVFPGKSVTRTADVIVPKGGSREERTVFVDSFISQLDGDDSLKITKSFVLTTEEPE